MKAEHFFVFDTNALISAFLLSHSVSRKALNRAITIGSLALSDAVFQEFIDVLFRKKFDRYFFIFLFPVFSILFFKIAVKSTKENADKNDLIFIGGSSFVVVDALKIINKHR